MGKARSRTCRRQVTFIGASYLFVHQAVRDMLLNGGLDDTDIVLYDIDAAPMKLEKDVISRMIRQAGAGMTVRTAKSRAEALKGADYVVVSVLAGGLDMAEKDDRICRKHGIRHTVGDTIGPMCTARMLRQAPLLLDIARDMEKLCPGAPLLSPTNPMAGLTGAVSRYSGVKCIGICHGTHYAMSIIAKSYGAGIADVQVNVVGVNHLGFIDRVWVKGEEKEVGKVIKKIWKEALKGYDDPAGHVDKAEAAIRYAEMVGFLPNNGDHHFIEFFPWFLAPHTFDGKGRNRYGYNGLLLDVPARRKRKKTMRKLISEWAYGKEDIPDMDKYGGEHIQDIILGLEGRAVAMTLNQLHLNVPNEGAVPNLPREAVLEVNVRLGKGGAKPVKNPPLDTYRWGVLAPLVAVNELATKAAVERDRMAFRQALLLDPLLHRFDSAAKLEEELWEANRPYFKAQK
ncbi:MAG: hypothetical protein JW909_05655 [Planctomycetes bacterium]|nr:hypothetical protein [Planctomycetota bacterium]